MNQEEKEKYPYTEAEICYEESYEDFSKNENFLERQKALEKVSKRIYDNDRE